MIPAAMVKGRMAEMLDGTSATKALAVFASVNGHAQAVVVTPGGKSPVVRRTDR